MPKVLRILSQLASRRGVDTCYHWHMASGEWAMNAGIFDRIATETDGTLWAVFDGTCAVRVDSLTAVGSVDTCDKRHDHVNQDLVAANDD